MSVDASVLPDARSAEPTETVVSWPVMPEQRAPWSPAQSQPIDRAARWLFDHGMPDPRGLEYVRARVTVGELWSGRGQSVEADGWLYRAPDQRLWFLGWNGTLYEPDALLGPADFNALVASLSRPAAHDSSAESALDAFMARFSRGRGGEAAGLAPDPGDVLTHVIMSRLGHRVAAPIDPSLTSLESVVAAWQWALFDRAVCAHMRGDDLTTLRVSTVLVAARAAYAMAPDVDAGGDDAYRDETEFASAAETLQREARRRLARGHRASSVVVVAHDDAGSPVRSAVAAAPARERDASAEDLERRAHAIIDELDDVDARQWGQPGGVELASDPRVQALIAIGEPAIPALIDALERDTRLTRSVHFWRDFSRHRSVLGVHEAAYTAIANILRQDFFRIVATGDDLSARGESGRVALARNIRAYWERQRSLAPHDRAWSVLVDDRATPEQWVSAAENIVDRDDPRALPGQMLGEPLRSRARPSVSELLERRAVGLLVSRRSDDAYDRRSAAASLSDQLRRWDPRAPGLRALTARWRSTEQDEIAVGCIAALLATRDREGDVTALREYARWIETVPRAAIGSSLVEVLEVALQHPTDPAIARATARVLTDQGWFSREVTRDLFEPEWTSLSRLAAARSWVALKLTRRSEIGTLVVRDSGFELRFRDGGSMSSTISGSALRPGTWPWRECDDMAIRLVQTQAERDALLAAPASRDRVIDSLRQRLAR